MTRLNWGRKLLYRSFWTGFLAFLTVSIFFLASSLQPPRLPDTTEAPQLFANQLNDNLKGTLIHAIQSAQTSVHLVIYSLRDYGVIYALKKKAEEGIPVTVIYDAKASAGVSRYLGRSVKSIRRKARGLMHQKLLVIDQSQVWIGSANFTTQSLRSQGNLVLGMHHPELARQILAKVEQMQQSEKNPSIAYKKYNGEQILEMSFLPDDKDAVGRIRSLIDSAKKTVRVAMYTWTRQDLAQAVIEANLRGVHTEVVIDAHTAAGASSKIVKLLKENRIPVYLGESETLLHHKFLYIDGQTLVNGSANWTKAAFTTNDDCFLIMHDLTEQQRYKMDRLWRVLTWERSTKKMQRVGNRASASDNYK